MHRLEIRRPSADLAGFAAGTGDENGKRQALAGGVERGLLFAQQRLQCLQPAILLVLRHLQRCAGGRGAGAGRILEAERLGEFHLADQVHRRFEIRFGLAGMPDDEIGRQRDVRPCRAQLLDGAPVIGGGVLAVHRCQHAVRARLHGQMQERHQGRDLAMRRDQIVIHVARMGCRVAQAQQAGDLGQLAQQPAQAPGAAVRRLAMPGIHVLPEQGDLARALRHQPAGFRQHRDGGAARLGAARVGHHAERAELVAALLDGQERGHALGGRGLRQEVEFLFGGEIGLDHRPAGARRLGDHFRQPVIGLRAEHDVHIRCAGQDFRAFRLRDAAGHGQDHLPPGRLAFQLQQSQPAQFGKHLLRRLVADMAGVQDHHVGLIRRVGRGIAQRCQHVLHAQAVIHVHLATPGDHVQTLVHTHWIAGCRIGALVCLENRHQPNSASPGRTNPERESGEIVGIRARVKFKVVLRPPIVPIFWQIGTAPCQ